MPMLPTEYGFKAANRTPAFCSMDFWAKSFGAGEMSLKVYSYF
jgi:hypothetical protein